MPFFTTFSRSGGANETSISRDTVRTKRRARLPRAEHLCLTVYTVFALLGCCCLREMIRLARGKENISGGGGKCHVSIITRMRTGHVCHTAGSATPPPNSGVLCTILTAFFVLEHFTPSKSPTDSEKKFSRATTIQPPQVLYNKIRCCRKHHWTPRCITLGSEKGASDRLNTASNMGITHTESQHQYRQHHHDQKEHHHDDHHVCVQGEVVVSACPYATCRRCEGTRPDRYLL